MLFCISRGMHWMTGVNVDRNVVDSSVFFLSEPFTIWGGMLLLQWPVVAVSYRTPSLSILYCALLSTFLGELQIVGEGNSRAEGEITYCSYCIAHSSLSSIHPPFSLCIIVIINKPVADSVWRGGAEWFTFFLMLVNPSCVLYSVGTHHPRIVIPPAGRIGWIN